MRKSKVEQVLQAHTKCYTCHKVKTSPFDRIYQAKYKQCHECDERELYAEDLKKRVAAVADILDKI